MRKFFRVACVTLLATFAVACFSRSAPAVLLIGLNGAVYRQDFDSLPTSGTVNTESNLPQGWTFLESGAGGSITFSASDGTESAANTYSYGTDAKPDRAFGELTGQTVQSTLGVGFINRTGLTLNRITVSYIGEQWRLGAADGVTDRLDFQFSLNATSLSDGTWTDVNTLDFLSPVNTGAVGALNGNSAANRTQLPSVLVTNAAIPNLGTFWLRWNSTNIASSDDGLAIDDFVLRTNPLADFDLDGDVDGVDFLRWQRGKSKTSGAGISDGDGNSDGAVDALDLFLWQSFYGNQAASALPAVAAVPEPATGILATTLSFAAGIVGRSGARSKPRLSTPRA